MRKKIYIVTFSVLVVVIAGVAGKQYDYLYLANKINVNGLELFMKEKEVIELFGEKDNVDSYCMGKLCKLYIDYSKLGIFAQRSLTKQFVNTIKITNPKYDILGIKPNQKITIARTLLEEMGFKLIDRDQIWQSYKYQKKKLTFNLIVDKQGVIKSVEVEYEVKKDKTIIY